MKLDCDTKVLSLAASSDVDKEDLAALRRNPAAHQKVKEIQEKLICFIILRNVSLPFLNHAGAAQQGWPPPIAARIERVQRADASLTAAAIALPCARVGRDSVNSVNSVARQIVQQLIPCVVR
ncbi:hypothetical protein EVAR_71031_1 [Eumeta japonica]|uniref:Uncharacterized protein n=1 Tax=Eumeta variegata TaxID=151549 RepID=A0A4C2A5U8_EUMVA|nr:hypothetical protein EVAR_71031_1 [Eumeta japonica]